MAGSVLNTSLMRQTGLQVWQKRGMPHPTPTKKWMNGLTNSVPDTVEYYSAIKRSEVVIHTTMCWMNPKNTKLSKSNRPQKIIYFMIPPI